MNVFVTSIPYCGMRNLVDCVLETTDYLHVDSSGAFERVQSADVVIVPLRRPEANWRSWWRRGRFDRVRCPTCGILEAPPREFWDAWAQLDRYDRSREILFVPYDHADRDLYLAAVSERVGTRLKPRWDHLTGHNDSDVDGALAPAVDLSEVEAYAFVRRVYA